LLSLVKFPDLVSVVIAHQAAKAESSPMARSLAWAIGRILYLVQIDTRRVSASETSLDLCEINV
jgi:hypothetical protein